jgi:hypothetical protein
MSNDAESGRCGLDRGVQSRSRVTRRGRTGRGGLNCSKERVGADDGLCARAVQLSLEQDIGVIDHVRLNRGARGRSVPGGVVLSVDHLTLCVDVLTTNENADSADTAGPLMLFVVMSAPVPVARAM